jgi:hypothetical protein
VREALSSVANYGTAAARVLARGRSPRLGRSDERMIFVVGSPRSGTTFLAAVLGAQPGVVDLGEVKPVKAAIAGLVSLPEEEAAARFRRIVERVRRLGLSAHLRGVEQTPETAYVLAAALRAYPQGRAVHIVRDGRDVVCSLLERGWLSAGRGGADDVGIAFGAYPRFWVEPERRDEFRRASDARRAAWAWRRYVEAARAVQERVVEIRYEELPTAAERLAQLRLDPRRLEPALGGFDDRSIGRWRRDLTQSQLEEVEEEAGALLRELGYGN